jgi:hypothetical protein
MEFREYYRGPFRHDLRAVMDALPQNPVHFGVEPVLQPRTVSLDNPVIRNMSFERQGLFAVALAFTVLTDQVCFTYFGDSYGAFRRLTMYPKLRGDCLTACRYHIHPNHALYCVGDAPGGPRPLILVTLLRRAALADAMPVMRQEVEEFFREHLPEVDGTEFWQRCQAEFPTV